MELVIFARFHARDGQEAAVEAAVREVTSITGTLEPGCLAIAPIAQCVTQNCSSSTRAGSTRPRSICTPRCRTPCASSPAFSR